MAHFAEIKEDNTVLRVIVADNKEWCENNLGGTWVQTSYNAYANQHPEGRPLRGNYAGIGYIYDRTNDVFYAPQPYASWVLDNTTWTWKAPVAMPTDDKKYTWDETTTSWVESPDLPA